MSETENNGKLDKSFDFATKEQKWYSQWEEKGAFKCGQRPDAEPYTIVLPPPNVTGQSSYWSCS